MSRHPYHESVKRTTDLSFVTFSRPLCGLNPYSALIPSSKLLGYCHSSASRTELSLICAKLLASSVLIPISSLCSLCLSGESFFSNCSPQRHREHGGCTEKTDIRT